MKTDQTEPLGQRLINAGIVTAEDVLRANKEQSNIESIGVRLVLLGALQDTELADFFGTETSLPRAAESELADCAEVFDVLPFEVVYDSAVLPIAYSDDGRLIVGVVDPHQASNLEEAHFFAGLELDIRILALGDFATEFERLSKSPWRIPAEELRSLRRDIGESHDELEQDLRRLFASGSTSAVYPAIGEEVDGEALDDEVVDAAQLLRPKARLSSASAEISVESVDVGEPITELTELSPSLRKEPRSGSGGLEVLSDDEASESDLPIVEVSPMVLVETFDDSVEEVGKLVRAGSEGPVVVPRSVSGSRAAIAAKPDAEPVSVRPSGSRRAVDSGVNKTIRGLEPLSQRLPTDFSGQDEVLHGFDSAIPSMAALAELERVEPLGGRVEQPTPSTSVSAVLASKFSEPGVRLPDGTTSGFGRRVRPQGRTTGAQVVVLPPRSAPSVQPTTARFVPPTPRPVPTVGEYLGSELTGKFGSLEEITEHLGEPAAATTAAIELALHGLEEVEVRDAVAQELVETLSLVYPTVLVLRMKLPKLVVWEGVLSTGGDRPSGFSFEVQDKSVWHRVASEGLHFAGTLPADGPLRRYLPRAIGSATLVVPLHMGGRVVAVLVLDAGATGRLEPPGTDIGRLCAGFEVALRRVIVRRKKSVRSV